ncbi:hypothetical protein [Mycobacterium sp.]|uniref:hypothetical protein n=1 Tax=Mycobacterium sp. TaxID=1785 RepID=UPI003F993A50
MPTDAESSRRPPTPGTTAAPRPRHGEQAVDRHLRALYGLGRQLREPDGGRHRRRKHVGLQLDYLTHGRAMLGVGPGALISDATMMGIIP